jgi:hypothetical protein
MNMTVEDCIERARLHQEMHPHDTSRSVSEMKEWVCSKIDRPNGTVIRDCQSMYTGGEAFDLCYANVVDGKKCLCSTDLCNKTNQMLMPNKKNLANLLILLYVLSCYVLSNRMLIFS